MLKGIYRREYFWCRCRTDGDLFYNFGLGFINLKFTLCTQTFSPVLIKREFSRGDGGWMLCFYKYCYGKNIRFMKVHFPARHNTWSSSVPWRKLYNYSIFPSPRREEYTCQKPSSTKVAIYRFPLYLPLPTAIKLIRSNRSVFLLGGQMYPRRRWSGCEHRSTSAARFHSSNTQQKNPHESS